MDRAREVGVSPAPRFLLESYSTGKRGRCSPQIPGHREPSQSSAGGFGRSRSQHGEEAQGGIGGILLQRELNIHDQHILPPGHQSQEGAGTAPSVTARGQQTTLVPPNPVSCPYSRPRSTGMRARVSVRPLDLCPCHPSQRPHGRNPVPFRGDMRGRSQGLAGRAGKAAVLEPAAGTGIRRAGSSRSGRSRERRGPGSEPGRIPPGGDIAGMVGSVWRRERGAGGKGTGTAAGRGERGWQRWRQGRDKIQSLEQHGPPKNTDPQALQTPKNADPKQHRALSTRDS